jgi:hypothetical protein
VVYHPSASHGPRQRLAYEPESTLPVTHGRAAGPLSKGAARVDAQAIKKLCGCDRRRGFAATRAAGASSPLARPLPDRPTPNWSERGGPVETTT